MADDASTQAEPRSPAQPGTGEQGDPVSAGLPTSLDALARELLAIRALSIGLTSLVDAALTSHRLVYLSAKTTEARAPLDTNDVLDAIRRAGRPKPGAVPRTFGDGLSVDPSPMRDAEQVHVPHIE
jgi:hypothetical protein